MEPIRARFAGTCVRTGQPYKQGDLIVKTKRGWALAQDRKGHVKTAPDYRICRLPDGADIRIDLGKPSYCTSCMKEDGILALAKTGLWNPDYYQMRLAGNLLIHDRCGECIEIITERESKARDQEAA